MGRPLWVFVCLFEFKHGSDFTKIEIWGFFRNDGSGYTESALLGGSIWLGRSESQPLPAGGLGSPEPSEATQRGSVPVSPAGVIN